MREREIDSDSDSDDLFTNRPRPLMKGCVSYYHTSQQVWTNITKQIKQFLNIHYDHSIASLGRRSITSKAQSMIKTILVT